MDCHDGTVKLEMLAAQGQASVMAAAAKKMTIWAGA